MPTPLRRCFPCPSLPTPFAVSADQRQKPPRCSLRGQQRPQRATL
jgi:hypothetical protein